MVCIYLHEAAMIAVFPVAAAISNVTERRQFKPAIHFVYVVFVAFISPCNWKYGAGKQTPHRPYTEASTGI